MAEVLTITEDPDRLCYRALLLQNARNWRKLGQSREGWLAWVLSLRSSGAQGAFGAAVRSCYRDLGGIVLLVWGQAS